MATRLGRCCLPGVMTLWAALVSVPATAGDSSYRWVDEDGEVHYGDRLPAEQAKGKHEVVDDSGVVRKRRDPSDRDTEKATEGASEKAEDTDDKGVDTTGEASGDARAAGETDARPDEVLLKAFANEEVLIETRDRRLEALQARIDLTQQNIERLEESRAEREERLESLPEDSADRETTRKRLQEIKRRLERQREHLTKLQSEKKRLRRQFQADLERFRELKAEDED